ncbi:helix-turn-helix transcriptional regulator [Variovorax paradoxus]|uniref:helix-turn-helix transcriptional regulator n=1 Tax=Variovorax paradoxus TaxID=34073 RepID=UPI002782201C|nr:helix-turn-helix domain-containing protein [Variovorax paradoxus]MDQ0591007.1 excisionase family DNA binding protein [Variovorax paradoxus]
MDQVEKPIEPLLDDTQVAAVLGISVETLAAWRHTGRVTLPFVRVGGRLVRYRKTDVEALIAAGVQPRPEPEEV